MRGLHYAHRPEEQTSFSLESHLANEARIRARCKASLVHLVVFDPLSGAQRSLEFQDVQPGDVLSFEVGSPYALFTLGALEPFLGRALPYEAWGVVMRPAVLAASLAAPEAAAPGAAISVRLEADRPADCLLVVYAAGMEHQDVRARLAQRIYVHLLEATWRLGVQTAWGFGIESASLDSLLRTRGIPFSVIFNLTYLATCLGIQGLRISQSVPVFTIVSGDLAPNDTPETRLAALLAEREVFPELAHIELFPVEGAVTRRIRLGDQPGTWHCRAYFFHGHDVVAAQSDVQVT
jgi:hypothetical protein